MDHLGGFGEQIEPNQSKYDIVLSDTEIVPADTELPPPQSSHKSGGEFEVESDGLQYFQDTQPVDDAFHLDEEFETQKVESGGETQVVDIYDETQEVNLGGDTQVVDGCDAGVLMESDGEGSGETQVLRTTQELSDINFVRKGGDDLTSMQNIDLSKQSVGGSKVKLGLAINERHQSGYAVGGFTSIRVASIRQSGLAARKVGMLSHKDSTNLGDEADQNGPEENNKQFKESGNENTFKIGGSAARKLFMDDWVSEGQQPDNGMDNPDDAGGLQLASENCLAGLSYMNSQEPGDLSQANALDFVDRFLEFNVIESYEGVTSPKSIVGKSKPVSSVKGTQSLAKIAAVRSIDGKSGIFKWDDDLEDEGGGEFFQKKKGLFFGNGDKGQRSLAHSGKGSSLNSKITMETKQNRHTNRKLKHEIMSDSKLLSKNGGEIIESSKLMKPSFRKNLLDEMNGGMDTGEDWVVDTGHSKDVPHSLDVGFDTQVAADAMETLKFAVSKADNSSRSFNEVTKTVRKSTERDQEDELQSLEQSSTKKRACCSNAKVVGQSKTAKRMGKSSRGSSVLLSKQSKNMKKQSYTEVSNKEPKKAKEGSKDLVVNDGENLRTAFKVVGERNEDEVTVGTNLHGGTLMTVSSGQKSLSTNALRKVFDSSTPVSHRTRGSIKARMSKGENNQNNFLVGSDVGKLGDLNSRKLDQSNTDSVGRCSDVRGVALTNPRGKRTLSKFPLTGQEASTQDHTRSTRTTRSKRSKNESFSLHLIQHQEEQSSKCAGKTILEKVVDNGNSLDKNCSHVYDSAVKAQTSKHAGAKKDVDNMESAEGGKINRSEEPSPINRLKLSASANATPVSCMTPRNATASPICMGDEYHKQTCRKSLLRSSLMKELNSIKGTCSPEFTQGMKDLRKRRDMTDVRAMFSRHLDADIVKQQKKILDRLGASEAFSISDATHFITDKFVRTKNMLEAIALSKPVVTQLWLESCGQANCFIDERNHILRDARKEKEFGFSMPVSLGKACQHPLLQGYRVLITPNTKPGKEILASLVKAVHGLAVERLGRSALKEERLPNDILVLSCEEDYEFCVPFLEKGAAVYSSELLLNGIVIQRLEYERHRLFTDSVKRTRSTIWLKKNDNQFLPVDKRK